MAPLFIVLFVVVVAVAIGFGIYAEHKRREMWRGLAAHYGLAYDSGDPLELLERHSSFALFNQGHSKKVSNTLHGRTDDMDVALFDYRYVTGSGKHRRTHSYSALMVRLPCRGALHIRPETFFDRIAAALGWDDYNFEYERFNRAFKVTGPDKKFAYDVCHSEMMDYLLEHPSHCWEIQDDRLLLYSTHLATFDPDEVARSLRDARGFLERLPAYLRVA